MTLRQKILVKDGVLFVSLLLMISSALWGFWRQHQHVQASLTEYRALQQVEQAAGSLSKFQQTVRTGNPKAPQSVGYLRDSLNTLRNYLLVLNIYNVVLPPEITRDLQNQAHQKTYALTNQMEKMVTQLAPVDASPAASDLTPSALADTTDHSVQELSTLQTICSGFVNRTQLAAAQDLQIAVILVGSIAFFMVCTALSSSLWQYRKIIVPLQGLREWCRRAAGSDFSVPYQPPPEREFQELGGDVNKMAEELDAFHRRLEAMVESKSRELVRSERLASVGYLAAGVAHEINNPLSVMAGYAELSLKRLRKTTQSATSTDLSKFASIIRSEAFRCKQITQKLLSLAKGNSDVREIMSLADAANDVSTMVRGLKSFRGKQLLVALDADERLHVQANLTEMKQVLLNLVINAIEAVPETTGEIVIDGRRTGDWVELDVIDNGRGMTAETLERVFEPFFTNKRGAGNPGTGLGLSVTHAIVTHHGGQISAYSDGLDMGSRFTIRIPAVNPAQDAPAKTTQGQDAGKTEFRTSSTEAVV